METANAWVDFTLTRGPIRGSERNRIGLIVKVRTRPDVEEFISGLAQKQTVPVDHVGPDWQNCDSSDKPLYFYQIDSRLDPNQFYSLDHITGPLLVVTNDRNVRAGLAPANEVVNLSFLRLVGVGSDSGIAVGIAGAYSGDYLRRVKALLPGAVKSFLQDYIVPVTINLQVISRS
jgi:hypothetical protein